MRVTLEGRPFRCPRCQSNASSEHPSFERHGVLIMFVCGCGLTYVGRRFIGSIASCIWIRRLDTALDTADPEKSPKSS